MGRQLPWADNYAGQFGWCLKASPEARVTEGNARHQQLLGCFAAQKAAKKDACAAYTAIAVEQQKEDLRRGCKFTGGAWGEHWSAYSQWCEWTAKGVPEKEAQLRAAALKDQCLQRICHWTRHCSGFPTFKFTTTTKCYNVGR